MCCPSGQSPIDVTFLFAFLDAEIVQIGEHVSQGSPLGGPLRLANFRICQLGVRIC